jgi:hypothetical protein
VTRSRQLTAEGLLTRRGYGRFRWFAITRGRHIISQGDPYLPAGGETNVPRLRLVYTVPLSRR